MSTEQITFLSLASVVYLGSSPSTERKIGGTGIRGPMRGLATLPNVHSGAFSG